MKDKTTVLPIWGLILLAFGSSPASAVSISLDPASTTVDVDGFFAIDVVVSGLGSGVAPSLGGFDLNVAFDSGVLTATGVTYTPLLGDPLLFEAFPTTGLGPGFIDFAEISLLPFFQLDALQSDTFTLATLIFQATGVGQTDLTLSAGSGGVAAFDAFGTPLPVDFGSATVSVVSSVPEPSTFLLLGIGLACLLARRRQRAT